jgi:quinoprotein glucose dehydrogenase
MDEPKDTGPRPHYKWPRFVLAGVVLGIVLAIFWMSALVHRIRTERENFSWPTPVQAVPAPTNSVIKTNAMSLHDQRMTEYADTLYGGNAEAGRKVFFNNPAANCSKCHKAGGYGGDNGPVLDGEGARESREFILESILFPNAVINTNYQTVVVVLNNGASDSGTLRSETESNLVIVSPDDGPVTVQKSYIKQRFPGASPMPEGIWQSLTKQELRDVIEFVATLKNPKTTKTVP